MTTRSTLTELLARPGPLLMEAAVVERLRRQGDLILDPALVHAPLLYQARGRDALTRIYTEYIHIAREAGLPLLLCTPTWRANRERVTEAAPVPAGVNRDAVEFLQEVRRETGEGEVLIGGLLGCRNDCYRPEEGLSAEEAEAFHAWQIGELAAAGCDYLIAETLPALDEAIGIARAMAATELPYLISFVIGRDGRLLDGTPLAEAVAAVDGAVARPAAGLMVNCAYPTFILPQHQPPALFRRLVGCQANASSLDHCDLDGAGELQREALSDWGEAMLRLYRSFGMKILGGCCGTDGDHLRYLAERLGGGR